MLDLFAGIGALGIEALSRGAAALVAVEQDRDVARLLRDNLEHTGLADRARVIVAPVRVALERLAADGPFDIVLVDPPYRSGLVEETLATLVARDLVAPRGFVLVEHARSEPLGWPAALDLELERSYGDSSITLLRRTDEPCERHEVPAHACT